MLSFGSRYKGIRREGPFITWVGLVVVGVVGPALMRYGLAVLLSGLALIFTLALEPLMDRSTFLLFVSTVAISALYGGLGPGLVAALLSSMVSAFFFLPSRYSLHVSLEEILQLGVFLLVATTISWLVVRRRLHSVEEFEGERA